MPKRVVILVYHAFGHINAYLKIAETIRQNGDEVRFAGVGFFREYVQQQGFRYYILEAYPFGLGLETWVNKVEKRKHIFLSALRDRLRDRLANLREVDLYWMLKELNPDIILLDALQATDFILLYQHLKKANIRIAMLHPTFPTTVDPGFPPPNSDALPDDKIAIKRAVTKLKWQQFVKRIRKKILNVGLDENFILQRRIKRNNVPKKYISRKLNLVNFAVEHLDEFVVVPKEFDFPNTTTEKLKHYVGFQPPEKRNDETNAVFEQHRSTIQELKNDSTSKIVYCSFGTIEVKNKSIITGFLEKLISISHQEKFVFIISLKMQSGDLSKLPASGNVFIFNSVPQLEVLRFTDVFITHGGMNSIKEAIYAEVPMLMYPVHSDLEPRGNAARVVYHGLGLRGDATTDSEDNIKEKIKELTANPSYKRNIHALKIKDSLYSSQQFLEKLSSVKLLS
jgi:zeaxanthin glucosyltransferase